MTMTDDSKTPSSPLMPASGCLDDGTLRAVAIGALAASDLDRIAAHLESCPDCEARFARFDGHADGLVSGLRRVPPSSLEPASGLVRKFLSWERRTLSDRNDATQVGKTPPTDAMVGVSPPQRIGDFEILSVVGQGAFGTVYKAIDPLLKREVAIKSPREGTVRTTEEREAFLREARALATINHPNVSQVHGVGEHEGRPFLVMAFVNGSTLQETLHNRKSRFPEQQAANIVQRVAMGLAAVHSKGIVHRDLKPGNLMFDRDRKDVVVMDFGLARGPLLSDLEGTQTGVIKGTPAYMSPEQARGDVRAVGPASDVFSLGVIFYELLTGVRPFAGVSPFETIASMLRDNPVPPSKLQDGVDPALEAVCLKALAKDPARRYESMKDFAAAINAALRTMSRRASQPAAATWRSETGSGRDLNGSTPIPPPVVRRPPPVVGSPIRLPLAVGAAVPLPQPAMESVLAAIDRRAAIQYPGLFSAAEPNHVVATGSRKWQGFWRRIAAVVIGVAAIVALLVGGRWARQPVDERSKLATVASVVPATPVSAVSASSNLRFEPVDSGPAAAAGETSATPVSSSATDEAPVTLTPTANATPAQPPHDDVAETLDKAHAEFEKRLTEHREQIAQYFNDLQNSARESGNERLLDQVTRERDAFAESGRLSSSVPANVRLFPASLVDALSSAYSQAIESYRRRQQGDRAAAAAKELQVLKAKAGAPSIAGAWIEGTGLRVIVEQSGERFTAVCTYQERTHGEISWVMVGSIARDGEIRGSLTHVKAPKDWGNQVRVGRYSAADGKIEGRAQFIGGGHAFEWKLVAANLERAPMSERFSSETNAVSVVGAKAGERREFTDLKLPFRWCPAGQFKMGSPERDPNAEPDEKPQVEVTLSHGFWLGETEVTQGVWTSVTGTAPFAQKNYKKYTQLGDNFPASSVSWHDAKLFCEMLTQRETVAGRLSEGSVFRLPTEAEWEYACRAGTTTYYCCGNDPGQLGRYAWYNVNSWNKGMQHPLEVGLKDANRWGLRDMHGNVLEWCEDVYADRLLGGLDPHGPSEGPNRVQRGGRVYHSDRRLRSANREPDFAEHRYNGTGFRVLLMPSSQ